MNKLAWRHYFHIITLRDIFHTLKGRQLCSKWSDLAEIKLIQDFIHVLVTCSFRKDHINSNQKNVEM